MRALDRVVLAVLAVAATAVLGAGARVEDARERLAPDAPDATEADVVPYDGRSPREEPVGDEVRVLVALRRPALGQLPGAARLDARAQRRHVASLRGESRALRSGLRARGVRLEEVVTFERTFNGFAATARGSDLRRLAAAGLRPVPVRRFYPAVSEPVPIPGPPPRSRPPAGGRPVALLAGGAHGRGYDAVDADSDPAPGGHPAQPARLEADGIALASVLAGARRPVLPIRVAAQRPDEYARTDELLAGLERAVDPDGDGATDDRAAVALVAVNAPFAGFGSAPEARAALAARRLGVPVVAAAGHEGAGGTVGSPGGAPAATTVGALTAAEAVPRLELTAAGEAHPAAALGGDPPGRATAGPVVTAEDAQVLLKPDAPRLQGRVALVRAGRNPVAQAAAAEAAGARAVLLAEPREGRSLPSASAGRLRVPLVGVTGEAAEDVLALRPGARLAFGRPTAADVGDADPGLSRFSSTGPALGGAPKPDVAAVAWADVALGGRRFRVAGAAVAAARVAAGLAGGRAPATVRGAAAGAVRARRALPARVGALRLTSEAGRVEGVRFTLGAFDRGDPPRGVPARLSAVERLELAIVDSRRRVVRRLTPRGGAPDLLPGEYAYALPRRALRDLAPGRYAFVARAWAPRLARPAVRRSASFSP